METAIRDHDMLLKRPLQQPGLLLREANILQGVHEAHVEVGQGDIVPGRLDTPVSLQ